MGDFGFYLVGIFFAIALLLFAALYIYYRFIKVRHTRERFAFVALATLASFFVFSFGILFIRNPLMDFLITTFNLTNPGEVEQFETSSLMMGFFFGDHLWRNVNPRNTRHI